jgi:hypothetical protein
LAVDVLDGGRAFELREAGVEPSRSMASRTRLASRSVPRAVTTPTVSVAGKSLRALAAKFSVIPPGRSRPRLI